MKCSNLTVALNTINQQIKFYNVFIVFSEEEKKGVHYSLKYSAILRLSLIYEMIS